MQIASESRFMAITDLQQEKFQPKQGNEKQVNKDSYGVKKENY